MVGMGRLDTLRQNRLGAQLLVLMATATKNASTEWGLTLHKYISCTLGEGIMMVMFHLAMLLKLEVNIGISTLIVLQDKGLVSLLMRTLWDSLLSTETTLGFWDYS